MPGLVTQRGLLLLVDGAADGATALALAAAGYDVRRASSWREGLSAALREPLHLVLIDSALHEIDGPTLVRLLRACGLTAPVLMLSSSDESGARDAQVDDQLTRPFTEAELLARVAALARAPPPPPGQQTLLTVADLELDLRARTVMRAGRSISLRGRDFDLLAYLVRNRGRALSCRTLLQRVWGAACGHETVLVASLRRVRAKVDGGSSVALIHTVPGVGYCLVDDD